MLFIIIMAICNVLDTLMATTVSDMLLSWSLPELTLVEMCIYVLICYGIFIMKFVNRCRLC